ESGRAYLDAVNNVPHVGHSHPRIVRAGQRQMAVLNTNTRYLHDHLVNYAEQLCATMPDPLKVCFFVNSGSEANDLALRLARHYTGQQETLILEGAYHGNLSSLIDLSPYKFDGPGGLGVPAHVHKLPMPDPYRGLYKGYGEETGILYADHVREKIDELTSRDRRVCAFIAESLLGCGGQIVLPSGYFAEAFKHVRAAGGVCITDEVQVGFGRVGTHFWGFETQGVVPDIVTMGKPIGNGHPLGAVITTPEIADAFDNGMEYFNTFGGNPVSCAIGLEVLSVIQEDRLQDHALQVGNHLMDGLRELMNIYSIIGDVRGLGFYIGAEMVLDRNTLEPAGHQASYVADRMKDHGILISTDGPLHNVLKIKPPMVFTQENGDYLVTCLDKILQEDFCIV
ncbi:MAG TPA: alanine--glyoxylate aminotransferase, partial [Candidatus Latescibacteria bacterium]|nr:alanine--glyoxylate aminotransferase [Candidatus Latescibacterota bacterium]